MSAFIRITRVPYEEPHHVNLVYEVSNGRQTGIFEFFDRAAAISDIASALEVFPRGPDDVFLYEIGSEQAKDRWAYFFRFRVFCTSATGQCAIQIKFNNNEPLPDLETFEFCIKAEPAQINRFGALMREFANLKHAVLEWSVLDGCLNEHAPARKQNVTPESP